MNIFSQFRRFFFIVLLILPLVLPNETIADTFKKVIILPFEIHSKSEDTSFENKIIDGLRDALLATKNVRVAEKDTIAKFIKDKQISKNLAWEIGEKTQTDLVILGSVTRLGNFVSVDVTTVDIANRQTVSGIFASGSDMEKADVISQRLAEQILLKNFGEQKIEAIEFTGNRTIENSAILNVLNSKKGEILTEKNLSDDIKAVYKMGYFNDVKVEVSDGNTGKIVTFVLEERPTIIDIEIKGNDEIDKEDIENIITVKSRQILNLEKIKSDVGNIRNFYHDKGFLNGDVEYTIETHDRGVRVVFTISEHKKLRIKTISFEGNKAFTDDELKDMMEISESGIFHFITDSGLLKKDTLTEDISKIKAFYLNHGYINASVGEPEITHDQDWIYVSIAISEGKQFKVGKVEITGDLISIPRKDLTEKLTITKKDYFDRGAIMKDIDFLSEACNNEGYAYANVTPETISHEKDEKVDVVYHIDKGDKIYFNRIAIWGNTKTRDKVIRRELKVIEGDLYSREKLKKSYMNLAQLRYFEEVDFQTVKATENLTDINIKVKEKPTGMFTVGAGYSAQDRAVVMAQISQRNLFGRGQTLSLNAYLGSKTTKYELSFIEPWLFNRPLWSKFDIWNTDREYDTYDLNTKGFESTFGHRLFEHVKGYIGYEYTIDDINNVDDTASRYIKDQEGETATSGVITTLSRDTTNDWIFPSSGSKNSISVRHTGTIFQGDTSFTKYIGSSSWFFPLFLDNVFAIRGRIGYVQGNEGKEIPVYERFTLGGIRSLRGLRNVGPVDPETGDVIGGKTMLSFNAEIIFPLIEDAGMKGVIFFDTGNAWNSGYHLDDMRETAGVGVRWYSPLGPLRLEWGYVLDKKEGEESNRWEFTLGMMM
ncbi:MAG: outer membrane protein assembly factor BamA [Deltaproteobacteria bacterium]|nr:outer membrane protein assembly factor BamA [Deltaproteobacteria bacterium]